MTISAPKLEKLPGTRPEGSRNELEASARVQQIFDSIAPRYDFLNHLLSFSLDRVWRRRTAQAFLPILRRPEARILDLCCGTGDLAFALDRARISAIRKADAAGISGREPLIGSDFVEKMLERAHEKSTRRAFRTAFVASDALHVPFPDST